MARGTRSAIVSGLLVSMLIAAPAVHAAEHVVQPGETLWRIAQAHDVDSVTLLKLNGIEDGELIRTGQTLKLPGASVATTSAKTYTVAEGDTLSGIAQQLNVSATALVQTNKLDDPDRLTVGAQLTVPGASASAPAPAPAAPAPAPAAAPAAPVQRGLVTSYTVQPGETLSQIARQLDISSDSIVQANALDDPNRLSVGTVLKVPLPGAGYTVNEGETLRDIALQAKIDLGVLIDFNDLDDPELIRVGQVIMIPAAGNQRAASVNVAAQPTPTPTPKPAAAPPPAPPSPTPPPPAPKPAATAAPTPKPAPPAPTGPSANGEGLVANAMKLRGTPYAWGGASPSGFDCSGFLWYVGRQSGKSLSRGLMGQYNSGSHPARNELRPGDLVFFQNTYTSGLSHNGIYIGSDQFVHAANEGAGVTVSSLSAQYWASHWFGATRLP